MENLQTNINDNQQKENNLKQDQMVHISENILQANENDSDFNKHCNVNGQNGGNEPLNSENDEQKYENGLREQQNGENDGKNSVSGQEKENETQNSENEIREQQNGENDRQNSMNGQENDGNEPQNGGNLPPEVKIEQDDKDSHSDGDIKKYKFRHRDNKPDYTTSELPHFPIKSRSRYKHEDSFDCDRCPQSFPSRTGLLNHIRKHIAHKNITYTCAICSDHFETNNELIQHKTIHKDMIFTCEKCKLAFTDHCEFLEHEITHTLRSHYKCLECGKYYNKAAMQLHFQYHFDRSIECEICHSMIQKGYMKNHLVNHNLIKCVECERLIKPDTMSYHMITHTGVKPYQCLYCGKGFAKSQQRNVHTRTHTNERPFKCEICHQKFKQSSDLKRHSLTHFDKKYECNICDKKFIHKESLISHLSIHSNTQRYRCELCNKSVSTPAGYKTHMKFKHSDDKIFTCHICNLNFKTKNCITRHYKSLRHRRIACEKQFKDEIEG